MKLDQKVVDRLNELIEMGVRVAGTHYSRSGGGFIYLGDDAVDIGLSSQWGTSCLNLLGKVFGKDSDHYANFKVIHALTEDYSPVKRGLGIMMAAKDDYENGYLFNTRAIIQAEVFDEFLDQACELLQAGYYQPAAVVAGAVLEDGLRKLCVRRGITL